MDERVQQMQAKLERFIASESGQPVAIERMQPLAGGASRETWLVQGRLAAQPLALVLRLDMATTMNPDALERAEEFRLLQVAHEAGVTCPRPFWLGQDPQILGAPFFLMAFVPGESIGPRVVRKTELAEARGRLPTQMAQELARIHSLPADADELSFLPQPAPGTTPAQQTVNGLRRSLAELEVFNPGITAGLRWLEKNQPAAPRLHVLHGDFRIGNLIVNEEEGLAAVIDWEFAHLGDPLEDLAWPLVRDWRFGNDSLRLGGIGHAEPFLEAYEERSGHRVDREAVRYWEIMGNMKWAVTCLVQAERHLSGEDPSVELASLGRRSAEMEAELLRLIAESGKPGGG